MASPCCTSALASKVRTISILPQITTSVCTLRHRKLLHESPSYWMCANIVQPQLISLWRCWARWSAGKMPGHTFFKVCHKCCGDFQEQLTDAVIGS